MIFADDLLMIFADDHDLLMIMIFADHDLC